MQQIPFQTWIWVGLGVFFAASCKGDDDYIGGSGDDASFDQTGAWEKAAEPFTQTFYVRPPGESVGTGDGSSWENAFLGLPDSRTRGARYLFASGDYHPSDWPTVETYVLDDEEVGEAYIYLIKATESDHGDDAGWEAAMGEGPAEFGALSFATGYYFVDGRTGEGTLGFGFYIHHRDCEERAQSFIASPVFFPSLGTPSHISIRHTEIEDCGDQRDQSIRSQDAIYGVEPVPQFVFADNYVHDTWRNHFFLQGSLDLLIEENTFARAGTHHESNSIAIRESRNAVIRRNTFIDSINCFISLQDVRNVTIASNVLAGSQAGFDDWAGIHSASAAKNVLIAHNTFFRLSGLNTGIRFDAETDNLRVVNNLWAENRTNQIMLNGDHGNNAFWNNLRVDGDTPVNLDERIDESTAQIFAEDPFVDAESFDLHLTAATEPGETLTDPFVLTDRDGNPRTHSDRGAYEYLN